MDVIILALAVFGIGWVVQVKMGKRILPFSLRPMISWIQRARNRRAQEEQEIDRRIWEEARKQPPAANGRPTKYRYYARGRAKERLKRRIPDILVLSVVVVAGLWWLFTNVDLKPVAHAAATAITTMATIWQAPLLLLLAVFSIYMGHHYERTLAHGYLSTYFGIWVGLAFAVTSFLYLVAQPF